MANDIYKEVVGILRNIEGDTGFIDLSKVDEASFSSVSSSNLKELRKNRKALEKLIKYLTKKGASARELKLLKKRLQVVTEGEREYEERDKLIREYDIKEREKRTEEIMEMRRVLNEAIREMKEVALAIQKRRELEEIIKLQEEIYYLMRSIQERREYIRSLTDKHNENLRIIDQYDVNIDRFEQEFFDSELTDELHKLNPNVSRQELQECIDRCRYKNNPNMRTRDDVVSELAKGLDVSRDKVSNTITKLGRDGLREEISSNIEGREEIEALDQEIVSEIKSESEELDRDLSELENKLGVLESKTLGGLPEVLKQSIAKVTQPITPLSHKELSVEPNERSEAQPKERLPRDDNDIDDINEFLSERVKKLTKEYSSEIESQEKSLGITGSEEDVIGPIEKAVADDLNTENTVVEKMVIERSGIGSGVDEATDKRIKQLQEKISLLDEQEESISQQLDEIDLELEETEDDERIDELMALQDELQESIESYQEKRSKLKEELISIQSNPAPKKISHQQKWMNGTSSAKSSLDSGSDPDPDPDPENPSNGLGSGMN